MALLLLLAGTACADTGHFGVTFDGCRDTGDTGLLSVLETAYEQVNGLFGTCPDHVETVIISDGAMDRVGKQVDSFSGWNKEFSVIILRNSSLQRRSSLRFLGAHELTHLAVNELLFKKDPAEFHWMEEGICTLASGEPMDDAEASRYILEHGFLDTGEIFDAIKSEDCAVSKNGYMQSYSLVKYMEGRYGFDMIKKLLGCPEECFDAAFRQCADESFASVYDDWKAYVISTGHAAA
ncbi:peptidase MA family metallohydrolase [Methanocella paludicola]|nr:hypothetical protein [Methanocella paludicola]